MTTSRRKLLQALGLGGVGLVTGFGVLADDLITSEHKRLGRTTPEPQSDPGMCDLGSPPVRPLVKVGPNALKEDQIAMWDHPDMDLIEAALLISGGYPRLFGPFSCGSVFATPGDQFRLNYTLNLGEADRELVLYRVYDVTAPVICIGTSLQGPVVQDDETWLGHRLASINEFTLNEEESLKGDSYR